jgi:hypothetical protein
VEKIFRCSPVRERYPRSEASGRERGRGEPSHFRRCDVLPAIQEFQTLPEGMTETLYCNELGCQPTQLTIAELD